MPNTEVPRPKPCPGTSPAATLAAAAPARHQGGQEEGGLAPGQHGSEPAHLYRLPRPNQPRFPGTENRCTHRSLNFSKSQREKIMIRKTSELPLVGCRDLPGRLREQREGELGDTG